MKKQLYSFIFYKILGWKLIGNFPSEIKKCVVIVIPHTSNLDFFIEITDNISANYSLSNLNILYHNQTTEWFDKNNIVYSVNPIYTPAWLQPRALSESIKKVLKQQLSATDYNTAIGPIHSDQDQQNYQMMLKQMEIQDTAKKIKMADYLPELYNMLT